MSIPLAVSVKAVASMNVNRNKPVLSAWCFSFLSVAIAARFVPINTANTAANPLTPSNVPCGCIAPPIVVFPLHPYAG